MTLSQHLSSVPLPSMGTSPHAVGAVHCLSALLNIVARFNSGLIRTMVQRA
jgi:hypothetical protein